MKTRHPREPSRSPSGRTSELLFPAGWFFPWRARGDDDSLLNLLNARSLSLTLSLFLFRISKNRTIEIRLDEIEQDTQCAVCLGKFLFFSFFSIDRN